MRLSQRGLLAVSVVALLSGCAVLPDTTLGHRCGVPEGVGCVGTQAVYDRMVAGDLPGLKDSGAPHDRAIESPTRIDDAPRVLHTRALYAPPEELRIWVNRWRDHDGDLHDEAFIYVLIGDGQWRVRD